MKTKVPPDKLRKMKHEIENLYEDAYTSYEERRGYKDYESASFYRGWHHEANETESTQAQLDDDEALETLNLVRPIVNAALAATLQQIPQPEMAARRGDSKSRARAEATEQFLRACVHNGVLSWEHLIRGVLWAKQTGLAWMKICWDPDVGMEITDQVDVSAWIEEEDENADSDQEEEQDVDIFGEPVREAIYEGDIRVRFVPSSEGFPNPDARSTDEIRHFFHSRLLPVGELLDMYPQDAFGKKLNHGSFDTGTRHMSQVDSRYSQMDEDGWGDSEFDKENVLAQLVEFWEIPSQKFPNGRKAVFSGETLLEIGANPLKPGRIPFVPIYGDNIVPGGLYPDGVVEDLKSPQRSANRTATKMREHLDNVTNVRLMVPIGSGIDRNTWGTKSGQIIRYQKGYQPTALDMPDMPQSWFEYKATLGESMAQISGYHDITRADDPAQATGRALIVSKEQEMAQREPIMLLFRFSMVSIFQHIVWTARQKYDDGRMVRILGQNGRWEMMEFFQDDFDFANDLVPEVWTSEPTTPALRQIQILENFESGVYNDDPAANRVRMLMNDRSSRSPVFDEFKPDRDRACQENLIISRGWPVPIDVLEEDYHPAHIEEHRKYMISQEFLELPPSQQAIMREHLQMHHQLEMMVQQNYGMQQQLLAGGDQFGGAPSPEQDGTAGEFDGGNEQETMDDVAEPIQ